MDLQVNERDFVVVEADRGEDIGVVVGILTLQAFMERRMIFDTQNNGSSGHNQEEQAVGCILRLATALERKQLPIKFQFEKDVVEAARELALYGFGLPVMVVDAEFQFDRRKLTLFYDCNVRIDFREFVRQLFSTYKARIWMKKVSANVEPDIHPYAALALATGVQFSANVGGHKG